MTDNKQRGVEQWRCGLCKTINDMVDDVCSGCHFDYDKETDWPIATTDKIVAHEQTSISKPKKKERDVSKYF